VAEIKRIEVQGQTWQIVHETHLQNNKSKMDRRCSSSCKAPVLQVGSPKVQTSVSKKKFAGKWMDLENFMLSEESHAQKIKGCMFSFIYGR
jgi:hypothetical protein